MFGIARPAEVWILARPLPMTAKDPDDA